MTRNAFLMHLSRMVQPCENAVSLLRFQVIKQQCASSLHHAKEGSADQSEDSGTVVLGNAQGDRGARGGGGWCGSSRSCGCAGASSTGGSRASSCGRSGSSGAATLSLGGILSTAGDRLASCLSIAVVWVVVDAVCDPLLADEEWQSLSVVGDVW